MSHVRTLVPRLLLLVLAAAMVVGCSKVSGKYKGTKDSFLTELNFTSSSDVEVTAMGQTKAGTYKVDGNKVTITISGESNVFTIDDKGCLDGGAMLGKYCKA